MEDKDVTSIDQHKPRFWGYVGPEQVMEDLENGLAYIRQHGWCQGSLTNVEGNVCAVGGIMQPIQREITTIWLGWSHYPEHADRIAEARHCLNQKVKELTGLPDMSIEVYNDSPTRTVEDIEALFEKTLADF
ncbi:hypothetical protein AB0C33_02065 [Nonomuraea sp. NPDC048881]|uniref:DUF6197 family protein n=1 Tax=Nonomuraea sp. NPDC048881 TaxID=3155030 RepID=UPI0033DFF33D